MSLFAQKNKNPELITLADAAREFHLNHEYLRFLIFKKQLRAVKIGRNWSTTREWIIEWKNTARKIEPQKMTPQIARAAKESAPAAPLERSSITAPASGAARATLSKRIGGYIVRKETRAVLLSLFLLLAIIPALARVLPFINTHRGSLAHLISDRGALASLPETIGEFFLTTTPPAPRAIVSGVRENLTRIFTNADIPSPETIIVTLKNTLERSFAFRPPTFSFSPLLQFFGLAHPAPVAVTPPGALFVPAPAETPAPERAAATTTPSTAAVPAPAAPAISEVITRKEIVAPADVSSFQTKLDALNSYILTQFSRVNTSLADLGVQLDSKTSFTTFARSEKIDQLIAPSILSGLTLSGDLSSTGSFTFSGSGRVNGGLTVDGALSSGALSASSGTFSGSLTVAGDLTVSGAQTLSGAITIPYFTATSTTATSTIATGGFAVGTSQFVVQQTSGNVGIGTSSPSANLGLNTTAGQYAFLVGSSTGTYLAVDPKGNMGIGTANPVTLLHLAGPGNPTLSIQSTSGAGRTLSIQSEDLANGGFSFVDRTDGVRRWAIDSHGNMFISPTTQNVGPFSSGLTSGGDFHVAPIGGADVFYVSTSTGNVGIGTTTPGSLLSVNGSLLAQTGTSTFGGLISPMLFSTTTLGFYTGSNASPAMTIDTSGNVDIGTTSPKNAALYVQTTNALGAEFYNGVQPGNVEIDTVSLSAGGSPVRGAFGSLGDNGQVFFGSSTNHPIFFRTNAVERLRIDTSGNVGIGTTSPFATLSMNAAAGATSFIIGSSTATNFIVDPKGNVGIGTANPGAKLSFGTTVSDDVIRLYDSGAAGGSYGFGIGNGALEIWTSGIAGNTVQLGDRTGAGNIFSPKMTLKDGNVGIGTTSPVSALSVVANAATAALTVNQANISGDAALFQSGGTNIFQFTYSGSGATANAQLRLLNAGAVTTQVQASGVTYFNGGNVGIGTTTPVNKLVVAGTTETNLRLDIDGTGSSGTGNAGLRILKKTGASNATIDFDTGATQDWVLGTGITATDNNFRLFSNAAAVMTVENSGATANTLYLKQGNVGIGTTSPWGLLSVNPNGITGPAFVIGSSTATNFIITNGGNVGIGTAAPVSDLDVTKGKTGTVSIELRNTTAGTTNRAELSVGNDADANLMTIDSFSSTWTTVGPQLPNGVLMSGFGVGGLGLRAQSASGNIYFYTGGTTERMRIDSSGNVGIGTTTPGLFKLNVASAGNQFAISDSNAGGKIYSLTSAGGKLNFNDETAAAIRATIDTTGNVGIGTTSPWGLLSVNPNGITGPAFVIGSSTATNFIVTNGGNVGIGTTSPLFKLHVTQTGAGVQTIILSDNEQAAALDTGSDFVFTGDLGSLTQAAVRAAWEGAANTNAYLAFRTRGSGSVGERMRVTSSGNVGIGTTTPAEKLAVAGNILATGCLHYNVNTTAGTCVDIAESYPAGEDLAPAFIVSAHPDPSSPEGFSVVKATAAAGVLGVISTRPAVYMEGDTAFFGGSRFTATSTFAAGSSAPLALAGRVPVAVNLDGGPIAVGDRIALSSVPGIGAKATSSGETIGIALAPFDPSAGSGQTDANGIGKIMVFVNLGYAKLDDVVTELGTKSAALGTGSTSPSSSNLAPSSVNAWSVSQTSGKVNVNFFGDVSLNGNAIINVSKIIGMWGKWTIDENGVITAAKVIADEAEVNKLAVGSHTSPAGVTLYDRVTGEPFCAFIANGAWRTERGACDSTSLAAGGSQPTPHQSSQSADGTGQATNPSMPSAPEGAATATTTDNVQPTPNQTAGAGGTGQATSNLQLTTDNAQLTTGTATTTEATSTTP